MRVVSSVMIWGLWLIAELLLGYDVLLINMQSRIGLTGCTVGAGEISQLSSCAPLLPPLALTVPTGGPLFSNGLLVLLLAVVIGLPAWIIVPNLARRRGASARRALLVTSLPASVCALLAIVPLLIRYPVLTATETCFWSPQIPNQPVADPSCWFGGSAQMMAIFSLAFLPLLATCLFTIPTWVMGLTETDRQQRWRWYFAVLYLSPFAVTLYGLFGGKARLSARTPAPTPVSSSE